MITDYKIQEWTNPIVNEADRPQRSAYDMKRVFDSNSNQLKSALNNLIDELSEQGASNIGINLDGSESDNVQDVIQDIHATVRENTHNIDEIGEMGNQIQSDVRDLEDDVEHLLETIAENLLDGSAEGSLRSIKSTSETSNYTIGENAVALGEGTRAPGNSAFAVGSYTFASGSNSYAEGYNTKALGMRSHAEGDSTTASGERSHAEGYNTTASNSAHAEGYNATASGDCSHAEGYNTTASGGYSHAEGFSTVASGGNSHAEGINTIARVNAQHVQGKWNIEDNTNNLAHIVGNGTSSNRSNAHTLDWDGNAWFAGTVKVGGTSWDDGEEVALKSDLEGLSGGASNLLNGSAEGSLRSIKSSSDTSNYTIGKNAVALGFSSQASGNSAHAGGFDVTASGHYSHAEGYSTTASGSSSHAEGSGTTASGPASHAEGSAAAALGSYSHAEGINTIARVNAQHVQGKWNIEDDTNNLAHIVGNGTSSNRSNAHTLDWDGNAWFAGTVRVGGTEWSDGDEVALKSDLEDIGGGVSDNDILAALIETDSLPAITTTAGAILTDTNGNIIIRY